MLAVCHAPLSCGETPVELIVQLGRVPAAVPSVQANALP